MQKTVQDEALGGKTRRWQGKACQASKVEGVGTARGAHQHSRAHEDKGA